MYFQTFGKPLPAPTLVCIPGLLGGPGDFADIIEQLKQQFHIILQDPNFQRREAEGLHLSREAMQEVSFTSSANDIAQLLKAQGVSSAYFIGFSIGGKIIYDFAIKFPGMMKAALITDVSFEPFSESDLFKLVQDAVDGAPLHLPWADLKKHFAMTISDRNLRTLIQSQVSYPDQKPPAIWKNGMATLETTLERQSLNNQWEDFKQVDAKLAAAGHIIIVLKSSSHSGVSASALQRMQSLNSVHVVEVDSASHFLHITHKDLILAEILQLAAGEL